MITFKFCSLEKLKNNDFTDFLEEQIKVKIENKITFFIHCLNEAATYYTTEVYHSSV